VAAISTRVEETKNVIVRDVMTEQAFFQLEFDPTGPGPVRLTFCGGGGPVSSRRRNYSAITKGTFFR
jgi:hypothetical protein